MQQPYMKEYLEPTLNPHRLLFVKMSENQEYDTLSMIDKYRQSSQIRKKMDEGNWSALNKGWKQLFNDVNFADCTAKTTTIDDILLHWIADIYVLLQWMYNIPSKSINNIISAKTMCSIYNPLHETSEKTACEKIYKRYFLQSDSKNTIA